MSSPLVTVVVPTRNRCDLLAVTLGTVLAQRHVDLEVVVVDEASSDATSDLLAGIADRRLRVLRHDVPAGVAGARNAGLGLARGRWVAFTDDDDPWAPTKLASQLAALADEKGARWCCGGAVRVDGHLRVIGSERPRQRGDVSTVVLAGNVVPGGGSGVLVEAVLARAVGGFDARFRNLADYDLWSRLAQRSPLAVVDAPLHAYRVHAGGMSCDLHDLDDELAVWRARRADGETAPAPDVRFRAWVADRHQRAGRRGAAAAAWLAVAGPDPRLGLVRCAESLLWPRAYRIHDRRRAERVEPAWRAQAETWLAPLRSQSASPPLRFAATA